MTATNQHSTANFNPADYEVLDYLDNQRPRYCGQPIEMLQAEIAEWQRVVTEYFPTCACGTGHGPQLPEHNIHKCRHCGSTNVRYIAVVRHIPTGTNVVFGDICVEHLNFPNRVAFKAAQVRARAAQGNANLVIYRKRLAFLEANQAVKEVIESNELEKPVHANNEFAKDILRKLNIYGELSPRQVECLLGSLQRDVEREERKARYAEAARNATPIATGRQTVTGTVVSVRRPDEMTAFPSWKMLLVLDGGSKAWLSVPASLSDDARSLVNKRVKLTATFKASPSDPVFFFGSRPSAATLLEAVTA